MCVCVCACVSMRVCESVVYVCKQVINGRYTVTNFLNGNVQKHHLIILCNKLNQASSKNCVNMSATQ